MKRCNIITKYRFKKTYIKTFNNVNSDVIYINIKLFIHTLIFTNIKEI